MSSPASFSAKREVVSVGAVIVFSQQSKKYVNFLDLQQRVQLRMALYWNWSVLKNVWSTRLCLQWTQNVFESLKRSEMFSVIQEVWNQASVMWLSREEVFVGATFYLRNSPFWVFHSTFNGLLNVVICLKLVFLASIFSKSQLHKRNWKVKQSQLCPCLFLSLW